MRLMLCAFGQETNTFSPDKLDFQSFLPNGWQKAETILARYQGTESYLGGALRVCQEENVQIIPLDSIEIDGGAKMTRACLDTCMDHLCQQVGENLHRADGLFIAMHGAGSAEGVDDLEGYTLERLRQITGRDFPIMSSLDIHCNITPQMLELSDGLFIIKEFPHTDMAQAGAKAATCLIQWVRDGLRPVMTWYPLPILLPNTTTTTIGSSAMAQVRDHFEAACKDHGFIDITLAQGFSANDQYWAGASVLIVAERSAEKEAAELASYFWQRRHDFDPNPYTAQHALDQAQAYDGAGYILIHESSDNPGSGCPGDGTHLLHELVKRDLPGSAFVFIYDPETAQTAHRLGVGGKFHASIGGKTAAVCGAPVELDVEVMGLADGTFRYVTPQNFGVEVCIGATARLRHGNVEIVVASKRTQTFDDRPLVITGAEMSDYRTVCIKSAGHFRAYFQERAGCILSCEMPGLRSTNLKSYPYQHVRRPIYPLDDGAELT